MSGLTTSEPRAKSVEFEAERLIVELIDGRSISVPLAFYPTLLEATPAQRQKFEFIGPGIGIDWVDLDLQVSVRGIVEGRPERRRGRAATGRTRGPTNLTTT